MFDIGWSEMLLIAIVALIVVGPKELPGLFRTVGQFTGKARAMARDFQRSMEQAANDSGLSDAASGLKDLNKVNLNSASDTARKFAQTAMKGPDTPAAKPGDPAAPPPPDPDAVPRPVSTPKPFGSATEGPVRAPEPARAPDSDDRPA